MNADGVSPVHEAAKRLRENIEKIIKGKNEVIELILVGILSRGHVLIEDVPGIGKTTLAKTLAQSLGCSFRRIQCTPDLLPSDITGVYIFNQKSSEFEFQRGPVFTQVLLCDEINRATPRTQSALLEAMEELQVSVDGVTRQLPAPFFVIATQNPIELEGTFPLPEAQIDRFLLKIGIGYPTKADDRIILEGATQRNSVTISPVISATELLDLQQTCRRIVVHPDIENYIIDLLHATRSHGEVELGGSPRAMLALYYASQSLAGIRDRSYVIPDDVKYLAPVVLEHRLILKSQSHLHGRHGSDVMQEIIQSIKVPDEHLEIPD